MSDQPNTTPEYFRSMGYLAAREPPSGEWLGIQKMLYTTGLFLMSADSWRTRFCYEQTADALAAFNEWDGQGDDPPGPWIKQKPEDRLNPTWLADARRDVHGR